MTALDTDIEDFFQLSLIESNELTSQLLELLEELPCQKKERIIQLMINFLEEIDKP